MLIKNLIYILVDDGLLWFYKDKLNLIKNFLLLEKENGVLSDEVLGFFN